MATQTDPTRYLRRLLESGEHNDVVQMVRDRQSVLERYGPVFRSPEELDPATLSGFLRFENNRHWWNLHRQEERLVRHFDLLLDVLVELVDETRPLADRVDATADVAGLTSDIYTAILTVAFPDRYGVWSSISEAAMRRLGLWPDIPDGASEGEVYEVVNDMLLTVAADLDVDLWTLDALWWGAEKEHDPAKHFVARTRPSRPTSSPRRGPTHSRAPASTPRRSEPDTFMCRVCFATKPVRLESDRAGVCVDCD